MILLTACLVFAGCLSLALSQERNWTIVAGTSLVERTRTVARRHGWILLAAAFAVCVAVEGPGFAVLTWTLQVAVASFVVAMTLSFRPGAFAPVVRVYSALWP